MPLPVHGLGSIDTGAAVETPVTQGANNNDKRYTRPHYEHSALLTIHVQRDFLSSDAYGIAGATKCFRQSADS
jgi:hypothetical protein